MLCDCYNGEVIARKMKEILSKSSSLKGKSVDVVQDADFSEGFKFIVDGIVVHTICDRDTISEYCNLSKMLSQSVLNTYLQDVGYESIEEALKELE